MVERAGWVLDLRGVHVLPAAIAWALFGVGGTRACAPVPTRVPLPPAAPLLRQTGLKTPAWKGRCTRHVKMSGMGNSRT